MRLGVLGPLMVTTDGGTIALPSRRERTLLAVLALEAGRVVDYDTLAEAVFGAEPPARPRHALATLVSRLRDRLGPAVVVTAENGYRLAQPVVVDASVFEEAIRSGVGLAEAMAWWRGRPYAELDGWPPADAARVRLEELRHHGEEELAARGLAAGAPGAVVGELEALVAEAPFRERRWVLLIQALHAAGRQADALAAFQRARTLLVEELGIEPGPELVAAEQAVLAHAPAIAARPPRTSLPTPLTSFVGRKAELGPLAALISTHRLVTLTGAGGVGKSRLAQRVAADLVVGYPGGVWWVELAPAATPEAVLAVVAAGVGLELQPTRSADEQLVAHLSQAADTLILLDNCEHVVATVAALVHDVLSRCPSVRILATSREPLGVAGEQLWRVASLATPRPAAVTAAVDLSGFDAAELFVERAREADAAFAVDDRSASRVAAICARLDGIPLALELAAARTRTQPIERIAAGLDDAFGLLTGGPRTALPRHQTLLASITWSHDLLDPADRVVLRRLAVCPTRFDLDAATAIAAGDGVLAANMADSLARLVDRGLVEYDHANGRYRMLETLRQFGSDRLGDAGEDFATRQRHAHYWAARVMEVAGPRHYDPAALHAMLTDVVTMLEWAMVHDAELADCVLGATAPMVYGLGRWPELHRACDWVLADRPRGRDWAAAVGSVSMLASVIGRFDVFVLTDQALQLATEVGDATTVNVLSVGPGLAAASVGDLAPLRALITAAVAIGDNYPAYLATTCIGYPLAVFGQLEELRATCRLGAETVANFDIMDGGLGPPVVMADHLAGELATAVERLPGRPVPWEMHRRQHAAAAGRLAIDRHDPALVERAATWIGAEDARFSAVYPLVVAWAAAVLGDDLEAAAESVTAAVDAAEFVPDRAAVFTDLAATLAALKRWDETATALEQFDALISAINEPAPALRARAAVVEARLALATGDLAAADAAADRALQTAAGTGLVLIQIDALETVAVVAAARDDHETAVGLLAATATERHRRGYVGRFTTPASQALVDSLASAHADAWTAGAAASLDEATAQAVASSSPPERHRPAATAFTSPAP
jgi:predicted ATPase/DNA-binding SARP family transcriptional activator